MKQLAKFLVAVALVAGLNNAFAQGRKEATIDLGKGAFRLTLSVPAYGGLDGPFDTAKNPGPRVNINNKDGEGYAYGEVMYNAPIGESGVAVFEGRAKTNFAADPAYKGALAVSLAKSIIKDEGFEGRAKEIDCPPAPMEGGSIVCYKMTGDKVFEGKIHKNKYASVLVAVSFGNDKHGYALMATVMERNAAKFNADPNRFEFGASKALNDLLVNHSIMIN